MSHLPRLLFLSVFLAAVPLRGEIFSLWPFGEGRAGSTPFNATGEIFPSKNFWKEEVRINGMPLQLDINLVDLSFPDAKAVLMRWFPHVAFAADRKSVV